MKLFYNLSIRNKIIVITVFVAFIMIGIGAVIDYYHEKKQYINTVVNEARFSTELIASYCSLPLVFEDKERATLVMNKLDRVPNIHNALLFNSQNELFKSYHKYIDTLFTIPEQLYINEYFIDDVWLHIYQPVMNFEDKVGNLYIRVKMDIDKITREHLLFRLNVLFFMTLATILLATILQKFISRPIIALTEFTHKISTNKDYSQRIENYNNDEIGKLYNAVNYMLGTIEQANNNLNGSIRKLEESEKRFKTFMDNIPVFAYIKDENLEFTYSNKHVTELFNLSSVRKLPQFTLFNDEAMNIIKVADKKVLERKSPLEILEYAVNINGKNHWLKEFKFPLEQPDKSIYIGGVTLDITESKLNETALEESFIKFKTLADYTFDWEYWKDSENNFLYISPSCERISGYKPEEFMENENLFQSIITEKDKSIWKKHEKTSKSVKIFENPLELQIITRQGKVKWISHICRPIYDSNNKYIGNRGTNRDITAQKLSQTALIESEYKFKQLSDLSIEGIVIHKNGIVENVNKSFLKMSGYEEEELLGANMIELLFAKSDQKYAIDNINKARTTPYEIDLISKYGLTIPVEITAKNISKYEKKRVVSIRDISEQKQVQQRILNAIIQTEEEERKRVAQELHDGLGPVLSTVKLYLQTYFNSKNENFKSKLQEQLLTGIDEALEQVSSISNNLSPHVLSDFGIKVAIQKFIEKIRKIKNIEINYAFNHKDTVHPDVELTLYRICIELINNTIKHANASKIDIYFTGNEKYILLDYKDDGTGFNFNVSKEEKKGMGLFNIVNRVNSLGGQVDFNNKRRKGIRYLISLPTQ